MDIFRYHAREGGFRVADRLFAKLEAAFARLAQTPGKSAREQHDRPALTDVRYSPITGFRKYLVFFSFRR